MSTEKDEMVDGIVPAREVDERSSSWREAWRAELEERVERGLVSCWELTMLGEILENDGAE